MNTISTPKESTAFLQQGMPGAMSYREYRESISVLHEKGKTTGPPAFDKYLDYSQMNETRMKRIDKTLVLEEPLKAVLDQLESGQTWLLITASWCGDAGQSVPVIAKMAEYLGDKVNLRLILRDAHAEIMQHYLTDGGNSIPKLIVFSGDNEQLFTWGPRPAEIQAKVIAYKHEPEPKKPYTAFLEEVQLWYAHDKTQSIQREMIEVFKKPSL